MPKVTIVLEDTKEDEFSVKCNCEPPVASIPEEDRLKSSALFVAATIMEKLKRSEIKEPADPILDVAQSIQE